MSCAERPPSFLGMSWRSTFVSLPELNLETWGLRISKAFEESGPCSEEPESLAAGELSRLLLGTSGHLYFLFTPAAIAYTAHTHPTKMDLLENLSLLAVSQSRLGDR